MTEVTPLAISVDYKHFLKDSDGNVYDLPTTVSGDRSVLKEYLKNLITQITEIATSRPVIILSENLFPNSHVIKIDPKWWYQFLLDITKGGSHVRLMHDRGTTVPFCSSCQHRVPVYFIRYDSWECPHCGTRQDTTENILKNMLRDYAFHQETTPKRKKSKARPDHSPESPLKYLFSSIADTSLRRTESYRVETDKKSKTFLVAMNRVCESIRSDLVKEIVNISPGGSYKLDYRGWVDNWYENNGVFVKYRKINNGVLSHLSVTDTIISFCESINTHQTLPNPSDPVWVVYWRNVIVDRETKRISLPRFRGRYLQLNDDVIIPQSNCFVEISAPTKEEITLRFVLGGNHPLKQESISGKHHRGRHRRNTRDPRLKFFVEQG